MIDYWRKYPKRKPKKDGNYLVTIEKPNETRKVTIAYYSTEAETWLLHVEGFEVVYWKKLPHACWKGFELVRPDWE